jgi:tryptophan 2,3-dioxygenase
VIKPADPQLLTIPLCRTDHVLMVKRQIDSRVGTGVLTGAAFLRSTLSRPLFPALSEARSTEL